MSRHGRGRRRGADLASAGRGGCTSLVPQARWLVALLEFGLLWTLCTRAALAEPLEKEPEPAPPCSGGEAAPPPDYVAIGGCAGSGAGAGAAGPKAEEPLAAVRFDDGCGAFVEYTLDPPYSGVPYHELVRLRTGFAPGAGRFTGLGIDDEGCVRVGTLREFSDGIDAALVSRSLEICDANGTAAAVGWGSPIALPSTAPGGRDGGVALPSASTSRALCISGAPLHVPAAGMVDRRLAAGSYWVAAMEQRNCRPAAGTFDDLTAPSLTECLSKCKGRTYANYWWNDGRSAGLCRCGDTCEWDAVNTGYYSSVYMASTTIPTVQAQWIGYKKNWNCGSEEQRATRLSLISCAEFCDGYKFMYHWWGGTEVGLCLCGNDCEAAATPTKKSWGKLNTAYTIAPTPAPAPDHWNFYKDNVRCSEGSELASEDGHTLESCMELCSDAPVMSLWWGRMWHGMCKCSPDCADERPTEQKYYNTVYMAPTEAPTPAPTEALNETEPNATFPSEETVETAVDVTAALVVVATVGGAAAVGAAAAASASSASATGGAPAPGAAAGAAAGGGGQGEGGEGEAENEEEESNRRKKANEQPPWGTYVASDGAIYKIAAAGTGVLFYACGRPARQAQVTDVATGRVVMLENEKDRKLKDAEDAEVKVKVLSNMHVDMAGVGRLEKKLPCYHHCLKFLPSLVLCVMALAIWYSDSGGFVYMVFLASAVLSFMAVLCCRPGTALLRCAAKIERCPPSCCRDHVWAFVGFLLDLLPAVMAFALEFFNGVMLGYILSGSIAVFALLMQCLPHSLVRVLVNVKLLYSFLFSGLTFSVSLVSLDFEGLLDGVADIFALFLPAVVFFLKAVIDWIQKQAVDGIPYDLEDATALVAQASLSLDQLDILRKLKNAVPISPSLAPLLTKALKIMVGAMATMGAIACRNAVQELMHESMEPVKEQIRALSVNALGKAKQARSLKSEAAKEAAAKQLVGEFRTITGKLKAIGVDKCKAIMAKFQETVDKLMEYADFADTAVSFDIFALVPPTKVVGQKANNITTIARDIKHDLQAPPSAFAALGIPGLDSKSRLKRVETKMEALKFEVGKANSHSEKLARSKIERGVEALSSEVPPLQVETRNAFGSLVTSVGSAAALVKGGKLPPPPQQGEENGREIVEEGSHKMAPPEGLGAASGGGDAALLAILGDIEGNAETVNTAQESIAEIIMGGKGMELAGEATSEELGSIIPVEDTDAMGMLITLVVAVRGMVVLTRALGLTLQACLENFLSIVQQTESATKEGEALEPQLEDAAKAAAAKAEEADKAEVDAEAADGSAPPQDAIGRAIYVVGPVMITLTEGVLVAAEFFTTLQISKLLTIISEEMMKYVPESLGIEVNMELDTGNLEDLNPPPDDGGGADARDPLLKREGGGQTHSSSTRK